MRRETVIKIISPSEARITIKEMLEHMRLLDGRLEVKLIHSILPDRTGPTLDEIRATMEQHMKELGRD